MSSVLPLPEHRGAHTPGLATVAPAEQSHPAYRRDIDGLRGIAVLSVLAVHSFPQWLKSGFIGVDIFFVLSGFLITGILLKGMEEGRYSTLDFYRRRVLRIFPALCLVLCACLLTAALFTFPNDTRRVGEHVGAGALFVSNFVLWREAGYFDVASEAKPLLHLWSLGIEEQFYLVWPLAVAVMVKLRRCAMPLLIAGLIASFACNLWLLQARPTAAFFLPPARFWELMMGALLAFIMAKPAGEAPAWWGRHGVADALATTGLLLLVLALWLIDKTDPFPGWWALLPTAGTVALLAAGPNAWFNRLVLSHPVLRFYGLVSYPLYLWHWPLLSFPVVMGIPLSNELRVLILIASVGLAVATYEWIEKPVRFGRLSNGRTAVLLCAALTAIGLAGWGVKRSDGLLGTYPPEVREIAAAEMRFDYAEYRADTCMARTHQGPEVFNETCIDRREPMQKLLFVWGDSHAASLYPGLVKHLHNNHAGYRLAQYTAAACPPLLTTPTNAAAPCARTNAHILARIAEEKPDTVVLGAHWKLYGTEPHQIDLHMNSLRDTVQHLQSLGVRRVVVIGHLPTWSLPLPSVLLKHWERQRIVPERSHEFIEATSLAYDKVVQRAVVGTGAIYRSPVAALCDATGCQVSVADGGQRHAVANDVSHLTPQGSELLVVKELLPLLQDGAVSAAAQGLARP